MRKIPFFKHKFNPMKEAYPQNYSKNPKKNLLFHKDKLAIPPSEPYKPGVYTKFADRGKDPLIPCQSTFEAHVCLYKALKNKRFEEFSAKFDEFSEEINNFEVNQMSKILKNLSEGYINLKNAHEVYPEEVTQIDAITSLQKDKKVFKIFRQIRKDYIEQLKFHQELSKSKAHKPPHLYIAYINLCLDTYMYHCTPRFQEIMHPTNNEISWPLKVDLDNKLYLEKFYRAKFDKNPKIFMGVKVRSKELFSRYSKAEGTNFHK
ncbi:unnamed protein product [Moneuplotes crassus]|uniref:Uncharacterized protein n=1 Tax=Euplotes crassus TaxID=5936 RepID=A0AAD1UR24_EUPCR|nr:unnamed protein product [Moneuplotes crassus]